MSDQRVFGGVRMMEGTGPGAHDPETQRRVARKAASVTPIHAITLRRFSFEADAKGEPKKGAEK